MKVRVGELAVAACIGAFAWLEFDPLASTVSEKAAAWGIGFLSAYLVFALMEAVRDAIKESDDG